MPSQRWPKERTEKFLALTELGWSAGMIAAELGLTRNAVIGKWHRSGISVKAGTLRRDNPEQYFRKQRVSKVRRRPTTKLWSPPKAPRWRVVEAPPPAIVPLNPKRLLDLAPRDCRFSISGQSASDYLFCANPKLELQSYCAGHHWIAHNHEPRKRTRVVLQPLWCAPA